MVLAPPLAISATPTGLEVTSSTASSTNQQEHALSVSYGKADVSAFAEHHKGRQGQREGTLGIHGVVGLLPVGSITYLITITGKDEVATINGRQIFVVTRVLFIPLDTESSARTILQAAAKEQGVASTPDSGYATDESDHVAETDATADDHQKEKRRDVAALDPPKAAADSKDVSGKKPAVVQFAQKWFRKDQTTSADAASISADETATTSDRTETTGPAATTPTTIDTYRKRIIRTLRLYLTSKSFYFSYDYDLSRSLSQQEVSQESVPLCQRFDTDVFWNRHLQAKLVDAGLYSFVLPLMQGFVGQRSFSIAPGVPTVDTAKISESTAFQLALISRRSVHRAGLRYLRRGIDDRGDVANNVETEHVLSTGEGDGFNAASLLQLRGSIPLYFSQSPYSFKPLPQMYGSDEENTTAFKKHFEKISQRYGDVQVVSLVDRHGTEATIGQRYEATAAEVNKQGGAASKRIAFKWFDFHHECRGMHFENVSALLKDINETLISFGWDAISDKATSKRQIGIVRTNCMDCLDRTNVVQSAISGWALQQQLAEQGLKIDLQADRHSLWFNQLWADNGDAISRQYAGTAALKGDFTRTRKRNWTGALADFSLTLNRFYNNIFGDYFLQTCIDYMLGSVGPSIFDDFEAEMTVRDHALDADRIRQNAVDVCAKIVLEDANDKFTGWSLSCPAAANSLRSMPFEECVLLLTSKAVYFCRFDWKSDKVGSFERIDLDKITKLWRGVYITNALGVANTDETRNVGFVVQYDTGGRAMIRTNTRSLDNKQPVSNAAEVKSDSKLPDGNQSRYIAFKIPLGMSASDSVKPSDLTQEQQSCDSISEAIAAAVRTAQGEHSSFPVLEQDVVSLADAQKSTSYAESISYGLKKLIW